MKIPYKEKFDPSEIPDGVIAVPFKYGPSYDGLINGRKRYTKEQYLQALEDERLVELYSTNRLHVEYSQQTDKCDTSFSTIDPLKSIGRVYALDDNNLYIRKGGRFDELIPKHIQSRLVAFLRCICDFDCNTFKIICWDVWDGSVDLMNTKICDLFDEYISLIIDICTTEEDSQEIKAEFCDNLKSYFISNMIYGKQSIHEILDAIRRSKEDASNIKQVSNSCEAMYMDN